MQQRSRICAISTEHLHSTRRTSAVRATAPAPCFSVESRTVTQLSRAFCQQSGGRKSSSRLCFCRPRAPARVCCHSQGAQAGADLPDVIERPALQGSAIMRLDKVLNLPAFVAGTLILYWSVPLGMFLGRIKPWRLVGKRDDAYGWALALQKGFGVKTLALAGPRLYKSSTCIYLCNHRSWADFYLDVLFTEGHAQMLSRWAVAIVFPMFMVAVMNVRSVILFNRGRKFDHEEFNRFIDRKIAASPVPGLIVYPEGHRSTRRESLSLKKGMLHYIFDRKLMTQIIITANKEAVISEKELLARFGQTILTGYSEPIDSSTFSSFEDFFSKVQSEWNAQWRRVYGADWAEARPYQRTTQLDDRSYDTVQKTLSVLICFPACLAFLASVYFPALWLLRLGSWLGPFQVPFFGILASWVAISFARAFKPVRLPAPRGSTGRQL